MVAIQKLHIGHKKHHTKTGQSSENSKIFKRISSLPKGFLLFGIRTNSKYKNRFDLALIDSRSCIAAGVWADSIPAGIAYKSHIKNKIQTMMINLGYAHACIGIQGDKNHLNRQDVSSQEKNYSKLWHNLDT